MKKQYTLTFTLAVIALTFLTSCGAKKSNELNDGSNKIDIASQPILASCNRATNESLSFNLANVIEASTGHVNPDWIKIKFNFLSTDTTQTGYNIKFFKWRIIGTSAQLDPNPLTFNPYTLSNGQASTETMTGVFTNQINQQNGFYIRLNDDAQYPYQVLKVVVYKTDGTIAASSDILIPQFSASPIVYKVNADGSVRADNLQKLHPLNTTDISAWTPAQLKQNFDQYCF